MQLELIRYSSSKESTLGIMFEVRGSGRKFLCYTLEDQYQTEKVYEETRIPAGTYKIVLREFGTHHDKYKTKFGFFHRGMLELENVPGFTDILIHIGNKGDDTAGCPLVGDSAQQNITEEGFIGHSTVAYKRVYKHVIEAMEDDDVFITIEDLA